MNVYLYIEQKKAQSFCILLLCSHLELAHVMSWLEEHENSSKENPITKPEEQGTRM